MAPGLGEFVAAEAPAHVRVGVEQVHAAGFPGAGNARVLRTMRIAVQHMVVVEPLELIVDRAAIGAWRYMLSLLPAG